MANTWIEGWIDSRQADRQTEFGKKMEGWIYSRQTSTQTKRLANRWMHKQMEGWIDRDLRKQMNGRADRQHTDR